MFATLFLGAVLAVFLTLGAVRGDAERGLLQPLRRAPARRARRCCSARFVAAARGLRAPTWSLVFLAAVVITRRVRRLVAGPRSSRPRSSSRGGVAIIVRALAAGSVVLVDARPTGSPSSCSSAPA